MGRPKASAWSPPPSWPPICAGLTPLQTGAYGGIVVFQAHGDTAALGLSSQSQKTSFDGTVYAPSAEVDISGQASVFLQALVAESATLTGQGKATAG